MGYSCYYITIARGAWSSSNRSRHLSTHRVLVCETATSKTSATLWLSWRLYYPTNNIELNGLQAWWYKMEPPHALLDSTEHCARKIYSNNSYFCCTEWIADIKVMTGVDVNSGPEIPLPDLPFSYPLRNPRLCFTLPLPPSAVRYRRAARAKRPCVKETYYQQCLQSQRHFN
jgi:hypothetical protein